MMQQQKQMHFTKIFCIIKISRIELKVDIKKHKDVKENVNKKELR